MLYIGNYKDFIIQALKHFLYLYNTDNEDIIDMNQIFAEDSKISVDHIYKILDADSLLAPYRAMISIIENEGPMVNLLKNFAELVQVFPDFPTGKMGGLLDKSLQRALYILNGYRSDPKFYKLYDPIWEFVFFSAGLLRDITKITDYGIIICNQDGTYKKLWNPCSDGAMTNIKGAKYYRILPLTSPLLHTGG